MIGYSLRVLTDRRGATLKPRLCQQLSKIPLHSRQFSGILAGSRGIPVYTAPDGLQQVWVLIPELVHIPASTVRVTLVRTRAAPPAPPRCLMNTISLDLIPTMSCLYEQVPDKLVFLSPQDKRALDPMS